MKEIRQLSTRGRRRFAHSPRGRRIAFALASAAVSGGLVAVALDVAADAHAAAQARTAPPHSSARPHGDAQPKTETPIKHLVVIFQEEASFDHYFGTYPHATNTDGSPFHAKADTPRVNGLSHELLTHNPNEYDPQRLSPSQALTCDQNHGYTPEQEAFDGGRMDKFVQYTGESLCSPPDYSAPGLVMDYYDGNTVTALWNYAQRFAMSDNNFDSQFGSSTPGSLDLISGQTHGAEAKNADGQVVADPSVVGSPTDGVGTDYGDIDPYYDDCSDLNHTSTAPTLKMTGTNIGNLLNHAGVTWGWFQGGFAPTGTTSSGDAICGSSHENIAGETVADYTPHLEPFQYYRSTANPHHKPPADLAEIGHDGQANHQYDSSWFSKALSGGKLPAVSFLKAAAYEEGHPGYSDPIDEQYFLVNTINAVERSRYWRNTAVVITYDGSDGWYDHVRSPIVNPSMDPATDALDGPGVCGSGRPLRGYEDRCGLGARVPMLVISPYARTNYVDRELSSEAAILRFIENNWLEGKRIGHGSYDKTVGSLVPMFDFAHPHFKPLILSPSTGEIVH